jgi:hypothetical protein
VAPEPLDRVAGRDVSGTLYIGESSDLSARLNQFRRSGWGYRNEDSHGAVSMLKEIAPLRKYLPDRIAIALHFTSVRDTKCVEKHLLRSYLNTFGDTPPLNYRL